jgi:hypothetical protein
MLLAYPNRMRPGHAFLGTTNLDVTSLTERFQTRFQSIRLQPPDNEAIAAFLARRWAAPIAITRQIAEGAKRGGGPRGWPDIPRGTLLRTLPAHGCESVAHPLATLRTFPTDLLQGRPG